MKVTLIVLLLVSVICISSNGQSRDIEILRQNLLHDALVKQGYEPRIEDYFPSDYSKALIYLESLNPDGSWEDIDYNDRDNVWNPLYHLDRLLVMAFSYNKDTSRLYQNKDLLLGLEKAISYWYEINPECNNWYKNDIAKQFYFNVIALLLENKIDKELQRKMVNDLTLTPTMTGSNRTLLAISTLYRGVLTNNEEMVELAVSGVTDQIIVTTGEGVQPDYSFHQHGPFLYNGGYGLNYLRESSWMATIVHGTRFAFSKKYIEVLRNFYLMGTRWMIRGGLIDYSVRGRRVGRIDALKLYGDLLIPTLKNLAVADPEYADDYYSSIELIKNQLPQNILGNKHFYRSDYTVQHRKNYLTTLKMCSERTIGIEVNMNSENKLGYWLPYGCTYIYLKGDEYHKIIPAWNWAHIPGATNPFIEIKYKGDDRWKQTQQTSFVGGVSNGWFGVSAMDFEKNKTRAKKAWFWFDDEWIALGAGIESKNEAPIVTTINQCLLSDEIWVDGKLYNGIEKQLTNPGWIFQNNVAYIFPQTESVWCKGDVQKGNMQRIFGLGKDSVYSSNVFTLWFNHGIKPQKEFYSYIVVPGIDKDQINDYYKNLPVEIVSNTKDIQAVRHKNLGITGVVFYKPGKIDLNNELQIKSDNSVILLIDFKNKKISASEPSGEIDSICLTFYKNGNKTSGKVFNFTEFNEKELYGKSITENISDSDIW